MPIATSPEGEYGNGLDTDDTRRLNAAVLVNEATEKGFINTEGIVTREFFIKSLNGSATCIEKGTPLEEVMEMLIHGFSVEAIGAMSVHADRLAVELEHRKLCAFSAEYTPQTRKNDTVSDDPNPHAKIIKNFVRARLNGFWQREGNKNILAADIKVIIPARVPCDPILFTKGTTRTEICNCLLEQSSKTPHLDWGSISFFEDPDFLEA